MIFNIILSMLIAYFISKKWSNTAAAVAGFTIGVLIGWIVGGILTAFLIGGSPTQALVATMSQGIWYSLAGAALGIWIARSLVKQ